MISFWQFLLVEATLGLLAIMCCYAMFIVVKELRACDREVEKHVREMKKIGERIQKAGESLSSQRRNGR